MGTTQLVFPESGKIQAMHVLILLYSMEILTIHFFCSEADIPEELLHEASCEVSDASGRQAEGISEAIKSKAEILRRNICLLAKYRKERKEAEARAWLAIRPNFSGQPACV